MLEGGVERDLVLEEDAAVHVGFDFTRDEREVQDYCVGFVAQADDPLEALL